MGAVARLLDLSRTMAAVAKLKRQARWSRQEIDAHRRMQIRELVAYARARSSYWQEKLRPDASDIDQLPVLDKPTLLARFDDIVTDRALTFAEAERFVFDPARAEGGLALFRDRYAICFTAGSSGLRGVGVSDRDVAALDVALIAARLYAPGVPRFRRPRMLTFGASTAKYGSGFNAKFVSKALSPQLTLAADCPLDEVVEAINVFRPDIVTGYPSALARLPPVSARLKATPAVFVGGGEVFPAKTRAALKQAFGSFVTSTYGTTECGQVAIECRYERLHVNEDVVALEVVDENLKPVPDGETGEVVLITNFFNRILPMFRYRFDDRVRMGTTPCPCGSAFRWIESIEGRSSAGTRFELESATGTQVGIVGWKLHLDVINLVEVAGAQIVLTPPSKLRIDVVPVPSATPERAVEEARKRALAHLEKLGADPSRVRLEVSAVSELTTLDSKKTFNFRIDRTAK